MSADLKKRRSPAWPRILCILCFFILFPQLAGCTPDGITPGQTGTPAQTSVPTAGLTPENGTPQQTEEVPVGALQNTYEARSQEELLALAQNPDCIRIVLSGDVLLDREIVFSRLVDFQVDGMLSVTNGGTIRVVSRDAGELLIDTSRGGCKDIRAFSVVCPLASLTWLGLDAPNADWAERNLNVALYNGMDMRRNGVGGAGQAVFSSVSFMGTDGTARPGITLQADGNVITAQYPFSASEKTYTGLTPDVAAENCSEWYFLDADGEKQTALSPGGQYRLILLDENGDSRGYFFQLKRTANKLPVMEIYTENGAGINSKETYVNGVMNIDCSGSERFADYSQSGISLGIKGRGNASWRMTDKKSYRLKLTEKASIAGLAPDRDYVLVSNYFDKSLIRNAVAHKMAAEMEYLYYTPQHIMIDLFINGEYRGVYSVSDKIEVSKKKINIDTSEEQSEPGFLIEMGWNYDEENVYGREYFDTPTIIRLFVKEPKILETHNAMMLYIMRYVNSADKAIVSGEGYEEYIDVDAMVDWFILAELTNNTEMAFHRSCYFYKPENGKITMGPVWDFDMAFGNHRGDIWNYDGWATAEATYSFVNDTWTTYLIRDEAFMARVRERWTEKKDTLLKTADEAITALYEEVYPSQIENFKLWDIMDKQIGEGNVDYHVYNTYELQVAYIREFIETRAAWIDARLFGGQGA